MNVMPIFNTPTGLSNDTGFFIAFFNGRTYKKILLINFDHKTHDRQLNTNAIPSNANIAVPKNSGRSDKFPKYLRFDGLGIF